MDVRRSAVIALAGATVAVLLSSGTAGAQATGTGTRDPRTITVHGTGLVQGTPDVLDLTIGVATRERSAADALRQNSELARNVIKVLREAGVAENDVQTSSFSVRPEYDDDGTHVVGYAVSNLVIATIRNLDNAGAIVDAATAIAGDEIVIQGLSFSFDDNTELVAAARTDAVKRARTQAEQLTRAAGVELGELLSMVEDSVPYGPVVEGEVTRQSTDAAAPIEPGSETLSVQVTLVYEIT